MKTILYVAFLGLSLILGSCEKELKTYGGEEGVYFMNQRGAAWLDSTRWANHYDTPVEFVMISGDAYDVKLRIMITGKIKDYDRTFQMVVDPDSTTAVAGVHYEPFPQEHLIRAGAHYADIPIRLMRAEDLRQQEIKLGVKLLPTADFSLSIPVWRALPDLNEIGVRGVFDATKHTIRINDFVVKPPRWIGGINDKPGDTEGGLWGVFTYKKYRLICEHFDLTYEDFMTEESMPGAKRTVIAEYMVKYLQKLYDQGTPVQEEDGRLMWFMGVSWTSVVGQPWVR